MKLAIHRLHDYETAKDLLADLRQEKSVFFFEKYVRAGNQSVFGKVSHYYATVETNDRGSLHLHGLLWLHGNMELPSLVDDIADPREEEYRDRVVRYVDSVFHECLDEDAGKAIRQERKPIHPVEGMMNDTEALSAAFDAEANFIAHCCQVHSHTYTCIKYSLKGLTDHDADNYRRTACRDGGRPPAQPRRIDDLDEGKGLAMVFYITNYATKLDTPMWRRIAHAAEVFRQLREDAESRRDASAPANPAAQRPAVLNQSRQFLMRVANRIFSERQLSAVEVCYHMLGYETDFTTWKHLRSEAGAETEGEEPPETVQLREGGRTLLCLDAYAYRGRVLRDICLYDYMSMVTLVRNRGRDEDGNHISLEVPSPESCNWFQKLRRPHEYAVPIFQGFISDDHRDEHPVYFRRLRFHVSNISLLTKSAEDARKDAKLWASRSEGDDTVDVDFPLMRRTTANSVQQSLSITKILRLCSALCTTRYGTSGSAAAQIGGTTLHSACGLDTHRAPDKRIPLFSEAKKFVWKQKLVLVIDEVSMLGGTTLYEASCRLQSLRDCPDKPFGGIPVVLLMGDFYQFAPVRETSLLVDRVANPASARLSQATVAHHRGFSLWLMFKTVVLLDEQIRARDDPELRALLDRVRHGTQTWQDLDLLNTKLVDRSDITFSNGLRAITPLNRNRWSLNMQAVVDWARFNGRHISVFVSTHTWRRAGLSQYEIAQAIEQGDDSKCKVPGIFFYAQGMPVVVNKNIYTGLKVVNGAEFAAADIITDPKYPGYHLADDVTIHFGPPLAILLHSNDTATLAVPVLPPKMVLVRPISHVLEPSDSRFKFLSTKCARRGLPVVPAFVLTDYKSQSKTFPEVLLELRGNRVTNGDPSKCDFTSLYVQLSRATTLRGIRLLSPVRPQDFIGNKLDQNMVNAMQRLNKLAFETKRIYEIQDLCRTENQPYVA
ncbi:Pol-like protein [Purpureocillium lavendulum]|uniref:ATP-dependent DNA helicase n=1 Tax=Purpureocillium lavendulum TaxID=1247861 RepID=A0AB34FAC3_9HYPO|nr:Pol-like protein [Purpureocillium lavendulum]